ncbi:alpha/beta fold hydrolase [Nocardia sp. NPDC004654]|uniref:alpha/beta fold hydrolase n=1 Tax=Nocardia sp. NPDC004654 TaxID=3154776 RepID=UPI00339E8E7D
MTDRHLVDVHIMLVRGGEVLLSRRRSADEFDGRWHLPAGKLEAGESATAGAAREALEEIGVVVDPADLRHIHTAHVVGSGREARLGLFFEAVNWSGEPVNREPDKCYELAWFALTALPGDVIEYPAAGIRAYFTGATYSQRGWPVSRPSGQRVERTSAIDGFRLAYDRAGAGTPVVLLHGWPSDRTEYRDVVSLLPTLDVVVPDLRGFGASDKHLADPSTQYSVDAQARSVIGLIQELQLDRPVLGGHDIGSRIAVAVARLRPDLIRELVLTPPLPGIGERILSAEAQREFWYVPFNQLRLPDELIDGKPEAVRAFLRHFWSHWSGPGFALADDHLDHLVSVYSPPGAFTASLAWYRVGTGGVARIAAERAPAPDERLAVPTTVLWPDDDVLFPSGWADRLPDYFAELQVRHVHAGHFIPLENPRAFATAITDAANRGTAARHSP